MPFILAIRPTLLYHITVNKDYKDENHLMAGDPEVSGDGYQVDLNLITNIHKKFFISVGYTVNELDSSKDTSTSSGASETRLTNWRLKGCGTAQ